MNAKYENNSRSVAKCDAKQNMRDRDTCYYFLSKDAPGSAPCEKISGIDSDSIWWKNRCYIAKAQYYKDPAVCSEITGGGIIEEQTRAVCLTLDSIE